MIKGRRTTLTLLRHTLAELKEMYYKEGDFSSAVDTRHQGGAGSGRDTISQLAPVVVDIPLTLRPYDNQGSNEDSGQAVLLRPLPGCDEATTNRVWVSALLTLGKVVLKAGISTFANWPMLAEA